MYFYLDFAEKLNEKMKKETVLIIDFSEIDFLMKMGSVILS